MPQTLSTGLGRRAKRLKPGALLRSQTQALSLTEPENGHWEGHEWVSASERAVQDIQERSPGIQELVEVVGSGERAGSSAGGSAKRGETAPGRPKAPSPVHTLDSGSPLSPFRPDLQLTHALSCLKKKDSQQYRSVTHQAGAANFEPPTKMQADAHKKDIQNRGASSSPAAFGSLVGESGYLITHTDNPRSRPDKIMSTPVRLPPVRPRTRRSTSRGPLSSPSQKETGYKPPPSGQRVTRNSYRARVPVSAVRDDVTSKARQTRTPEADPFPYLVGGIYDDTAPPDLFRYAQGNHRNVSPDTPDTSSRRRTDRLHQSEPRRRQTHGERMAHTGLQTTTTYSKRKRTDYRLPEQPSPLDDGISYRYDRTKRLFSTSRWPPSLTRHHSEDQPPDPFTPYSVESPLHLPEALTNAIGDYDSVERQDAEEVDANQRPRKRHAGARNGPWPDARIDGLFNNDPDDEITRAIRREQGEIALTDAFRPNPNSQYTEPEYVVQRHNGRFVTSDKTERRSERVNRDYGVPVLQMTTSTQGQQNLDRYIRDVPRRSRDLWRSRNPRARPPIPISTRTVLRKRRPTALVAAEKASKGLNYMRSIRTIPFGEKDALEEIKRRSSKASMVVNADLVRAGQREARLEKLSKLALDHKRVRQRCDDRPGVEPRIEGSLPSEGIVTPRPIRRYRHDKTPVRLSVAPLTFTRVPSPLPLPQIRRRPLVSSDTPVGHTDSPDTTAQRPRTTTTDTGIDSRTTESTDRVSPPIAVEAPASQAFDGCQAQPVDEAERLGDNLPLRRRERIRARFEEEHIRDTEAYLAEIQRELADAGEVVHRQEDERLKSVPRWQERADISGSAGAHVPNVNPQQQADETQQHTEEVLAGVLDRMSAANGRKNEIASGSDWGPAPSSIMTSAQIATTRSETTKEPTQRATACEVAEAPGDSLPRGRSWQEELDALNSLEDQMFTASQAHNLLSTVKYGLEEGAGIDINPGIGRSAAQGDVGLNVNYSSTSSRGAHSATEASRAISGVSALDQTPMDPAERGLIAKKGERVPAIPEPTQRIAQQVTEAVGLHHPDKIARASSSAPDQTIAVPAQSRLSQQLYDPASSWDGAPHLEEAAHDKPLSKVIGVKPWSRSKTALPATVATAKNRTVLKDGMSGLQMTEYLHGVLNSVPSVKTEMQLRNEQRRRRIADKRKKEKDVPARRLTEYQGFEERRLRAEQLELISRESERDEDDPFGPSGTRMQPSAHANSSVGAGPLLTKRCGGPGREGEDRAIPASSADPVDFHLSPTQINMPSSPIRGRARTWSRRSITANSGGRRKAQQWADTQESRDVLALPYVNLTIRPSGIQQPPQLSSPIPKPRRPYDVFAETSDEDDGEADGGLEGSGDEQGVELLEGEEVAEEARFAATGRVAELSGRSARAGRALDKYAGPRQSGIRDRHSRPGDHGPQRIGDHARETDGPSADEQNDIASRARTLGGSRLPAARSNDTRSSAPPRKQLQARPSSLISRPGLTRSEFRPPLKTHEPPQAGGQRRRT